MWINNIFYEYVIIIPMVAFVTTIIIKTALLFLSRKTENIMSVALWSGGMPSAHSSFSTSLTTAIGIKNWIQDDLFTISFIFTIIIIYDAINVRYEAWLHAWLLNKEHGSNFNESLWHLPSEAFVWSIVWILVAIILAFI